MSKFISSSKLPTLSEKLFLYLLMAATTTFSDESIQIGIGTIATAWLPVTVAWPLDAACSTQIYAQRAGLGGRLIAYDPLYGSKIVPLAATAIPCLPPQLTSSWSQSDTATTTVLGPTFVCPEAYTAAQTLLLNSVTEHIFCCPSQYTFNTPVTGYSVIISQCSSLLSTGQTLTYESTTPSGPWGIVTSTVPSTSLPSQGPTVVWGMHVNGYNILGTATTITSPAGITSTQSTLLTSTSSSSFLTSTSSSQPTSLTSVSTQGKGSSSLTTGVGAGIGVGVGALVVLGAIAAFFASRLVKKRGKGRKNREIQAERGYPGDDLGFHDPNKKNAQHLVHELPNQEIRDVRVHEMPVSRNCG